MGMMGNLMSLIMLIDLHPGIKLVLLILNKGIFLLI